MSCVSCQTSPCVCPELPECEAPTSRCDLYVPGSDNVWVERGDGPSDGDAPGVCMLDTLEDCQIIYILQRDEKARQDLIRITSDPHLLELARTTPRLPVVERMDAEQAQFNQPNNPGSIPFYAVFRGQPPFSQ